MKTANQIKAIVKELVKGNDKNFHKLKKLIKSLFKGKTQKEVDKLDKDFIVAIRNSLEIFKKDKLSEIDRAFVAYNFKIKTEEYVFLEHHKKIDLDIFKKFVEEFLGDTPVKSKIRVFFLAFIGQVLLSNGWGWHDEELINEDKNLYININTTEFNDNPTLNIFMAATKKYDNLFRRLKYILAGSKNVKK